MDERGGGAVRRVVILLLFSFFLSPCFVSYFFVATLCWRRKANKRDRVFVPLIPYASSPAEIPLAKSLFLTWRTLPSSFGREKTLLNSKPRRKRKRDKYNKKIYYLMSGSYHFCASARFCREVTMSRLRR